MSVPTYAPPSNSMQQLRQSRRSLWIAVGVAVLLSIITFGVIVTLAVAFSLNAFFSRTDSPISVTANYYLALQNQDYAQAHRDLDSNATVNGHRVDQQIFSNLAHKAVIQDGPVYGYSIEVNGDASHPVVTVHRTGRTYDVHLQLKQEGNAWKIVSIDSF